MEIEKIILKSSSGEKIELTKEEALEMYTTLKDLLGEKEQGFVPIVQPSSPSPVVVPQVVYYHI